MSHRTAYKFELGWLEQWQRQASGIIKEFGKGVAWMPSGMQAAMMQSLSALSLVNFQIYLR
ncbi:hypothetical protein FRC08_015111 [Ceratobasidium sp. 394]|nr:hypothetical protein FRC08_015111 [Ceratobasidium sp. 394]